MVKTTTGVDRAVVAGITFIQPDGREVLGSFVTAQDRQSPITRCSLIQGSHGFIEIGGPPIRPWIITVTRWKNEENLSLSRTLPDETETYDFREQPGGMRGCAWEADDVARCIRDGKKESERMPLRESLLMMQVRRLSPFLALLLALLWTSELTEDWSRRSSTRYEDSTTLLSLQRSKASSCCRRFVADREC